MHNNKQQASDNFSSISLGVASPEEILVWSYGEVRKPETINYRTQKPERDGLFCEKIFGPTKNYECYCGKYKRIRYKGVICEKCGVEVTKANVRRERLGHIKLAVPVSHIWFLRSTPSRVGLLLDLPIKALEQVIYFAAYIIIDLDEEAKKEALEQLDKEHKNFRKRIQDEAKEVIADLAENKSGGMISQTPEEIEKEYAEKLEEVDQQHANAKEELSRLHKGNVYSELEYREMSMKFGHVFKAGSGAEAIKEIIEKTDLQKLFDQLKEESKTTNGQKYKKVIKRIKLVGSLMKSEIKPEWMIMTILPVIPPDLRPMVQLDGGRYAASDLNDLYRRVINRNNRLKRLMNIGAPEVICRNEKRMLQEAVDTLINNSARQGRTVFNSGDKRKLRSLSDMLKGKQGRFRQNLLGKRVDYSGRSVIVVGPNLKLHQCGLPKTMALELFKPFVIGRLIRDGHAHNIKNAEKLIIANQKEVWDILEEVSKNHYVLLNRAPTLHRLGIQAFQPILIEGKAIQVHPLVCAAFNADFDGDQMAVHVPLSEQAQKESREIMVSTHNILKPSAGEAITTPSQDMVLGCYYMTKDRQEPKKSDKKEMPVFADSKEATIAEQLGHVHIQEKIKIRLNGEIIETTVGRIKFNEMLPEGAPFMNITMGKKQIENLVADTFDKYGEKITAKLVDDIKKTGFHYATRSGLSIAASDMIVPEAKGKIVDEAAQLVKQISDQHQNGFATEEERYTNTIKVWSKAKNDITACMIESISEENDIHYMINSGARGNWGQITQLCGMKGLVTNPAGKTIELPVKSNLKEGFNILEYFIASHSGRKGKSDTALKTAEAGYLTRRLVDAVQDVIIKEEDCGNSVPMEISRINSEKVGEDFENRIFGRTITDSLVDPKTGEIIAEAQSVIDKDLLKKIEESKIDRVKVRSVVQCRTQGGVCVKCYGLDLGTYKTVEVGTAAGIIAAQSIGEPGTQLTMRTFHMGGVAEGGDITQGLTRVEELFEARPPKSAAILSEISGTVSIAHKNHKIELTVTSDGPISKPYFTEPHQEILVKIGDKVAVKQTIAKSKENKSTVKATDAGIIVDIEGNKITIETETAVEKTYTFPQKKSPIVKNNQKVEKGQALTAGHINLRDLMELKNFDAVQAYLLSEVVSIYSSQGQSINDKHIEVIVRQMLSKAKVADSGDTELLPGEVHDFIELDKANQKLIKKGLKPATFERLLLGLTRLSLQTNSWLSAASFQETIRVLVEAATTKKLDTLDGLKENVIIGRLIPAGETYKNRHLKIKKS
jgi:DNA-directed RNA polymerase subunit beta'